MMIRQSTIEASIETQASRVGASTKQKQSRGAENHQADADSSVLASLTHECDEHCGPDCLAEGPLWMIEKEAIVLRYIMRCGCNPPSAPPWLTTEELAVLALRTIADEASDALRKLTGTPDDPLLACPKCSNTGLALIEGDCEETDAHMTQGSFDPLLGHEREENLDNYCCQKCKFEFFAIR